ncbi:MAG: hypothetical protein WEA75_12165 [Acidimicrobiia bacterium]
MADMPPVTRRSNQLQTETEGDIAEFVAGKVAHYKRLGKITFVDAVPKLPSGKILRRLLRDQV